MASPAMKRSAPASRPAIAPSCSTTWLTSITDRLGKAADKRRVSSTLSAAFTRLTEAR